MKQPTGNFQGRSFLPEMPGCGGEKHPLGLDRIKPTNQAIHQLLAA
jgi:hypothetical protein